MLIEEAARESIAIGGRKCMPMNARSTRPAGRSLPALFYVSLTACEAFPDSAPPRNLFVPASLACDVLHPSVRSSPPASGAPPPENPAEAYEPAGPVSLGGPKRGEILWRIEQDLGDMLIAPDGEGGVFLLPYGRDPYGAPHAAARLDGTGEIIWHQRLPTRGFVHVAVLPSTPKRPVFVGSLVEQSQDGYLQATDIGYMDVTGNIQRVKLGPGVDVTQLDVGADGSVAFTCTAVAEVVVAGERLSSVTNDELFVGRIDPQRRLDWIVPGGVGAAVDVAASSNGEVQYLTRSDQGRLEIFKANKEGKQFVATLPSCSGEGAVVALDGESHAFIAEDGCSTDQKTHDLSSYDLTGREPVRRWQVDFLADGDKPLSLGIFAGGEIVLVSHRALATVTASGHPTIVAQLAAHPSCWSGDPGIRSIVVNGDAIFTSAGCVNSTLRDIRVTTTMITRYAAH